MTASDAPPAYEQPASDISLALTASPDGKDVLITVTPPREHQGAPVEKKEDALKYTRAPVDFVLTIDVSGSMATNAPVPGDDEYGGLSVLDVVKHAAKTIILTMRDDDRVAIVAFSGGSEIVLPLTHTTEQGKKDAISKVETLKPLDSTNLWDGLKTSMNVLTGGPPPSSTSRIVSSMRSVLSLGQSGSSRSSPPAAAAKRLSSIFLLTDGMPNVNPPRGHIPMLQRYLESNPAANFTINTFGFGYSLDSPLLSDLAKVGGGHFGFIPDSGMVGTVFVHAVANTYATYAGNLFIDIETASDAVAKSLTVEGGFEVTRSSWGVQVPLGVLQYGQTRDLVVKLPGSLEKTPLTITARCSPWDVDGELKTTRVINSSDIPTATSVPDTNLTYNHFRLTFASKVGEVFKSQKAENTRYASVTDDLVEAAVQYAALVAEIKAAFPNGKSGAEQAVIDALDLAEDIEGQVLLGVKDDAAYRKWGRHYLLSLSRSHQRQQCGNFKDPGLQPYGRDSPLFKASRDEIDKTFDDLPPPKPSITIRPQLPQMHGATGAAAPRGRMAPGGAAPQMQMQKQSKAVYSMSQYNSRSAPCFAGRSQIELADGSSIAVQNLSAENIVKTPCGGAKVVAIVKTLVDGAALELCAINDRCLVTPWHPILNGGEWKFPADVAKPEFQTCDAVYSILLQPNDLTDAHAVFIGGVRCVTLGHGVVHDPKDVRSHPFLSDYTAICTQMMDCAGTDGVKVAVGTTRDAATGLMSGFVWKDAAPTTKAAEFKLAVQPIVLATA